MIRVIDEVSRLKIQKSNEAAKISKLESQVVNAKQAIKRTNSTSTQVSKLNEIARLESQKTIILKKIAEYDKNIARREKDLATDQKNLNKEESNQLRKKEFEAKKTAQQYQRRFEEVDVAINKHDIQQQFMRVEIERLQKLPVTITVLFLAANPTDGTQLRLDEEARMIQDRIRKSEHRDAVKFETRWAVRPLDILEACNELKPTVIHFSGHGSASEEIIFLREDGTAKSVSKKAIVEMIAATAENTRLVFFNTCYSKAQAESIVHDIEAAIGMNTSIGDEAARVFAANFYSAIGFGLSLQKAFRQAKAALMVEGINEENTPELFVTCSANPDEIFLVAK